MTPGTRVAIERPPLPVVEHVVADKLTGRTGTVVTSTPPWVQVRVDGHRGPTVTIRETELTILEVDQERAR